MGDIVDLQGKPVPTRDDIEFIADMARFSESILTEKAIRKKYRLADDVWNALGNDDNLVRAIEAESVRRVRDGSCKREKSQLLVLKAPDVAASIMLSESANDRHRLDACKVLSDFSANGPAGAPAADRFQITINLGADTVRFDRSIEINPNDLDPNDPTPSQVVFPVKVERDDQWESFRAISEGTTAGAGSAAPLGNPPTGAKAARLAAKQLDQTHHLRARYSTPGA